MDLAQIEHTDSLLVQQVRYVLFKKIFVTLYSNIKSDEAASNSVEYTYKFFKNITCYVVLLSVEIPRLRSW